jgi:hypothetical protein
MSWKEMTVSEVLAEEEPMLRRTLPFVMLISIACCCLPAWPASAEVPQDAGGGQFNTMGERIGVLRLGMPEKGVHANIPCKPKKSKEVLEAATGEYMQTWKYPECGVKLKMSSERKGGSRTVASITVSSPSKLVTARGIRIGSTEAEVLEAYGRYKEEEDGYEKGNRFVAGSIYDGMIFDFKDGRVVTILLGAAAE